MPRFAQARVDGSHFPHGPAHVAVRRSASPATGPAAPAASLAAAAAAARCPAAAPLARRRAPPRPRSSIAASRCGRSPTVAAALASASRLAPRPARVAAARRRRARIALAPGAAAAAQGGAAAAPSAACCCCVPLACAGAAAAGPGVVSFAYDQPAGGRPAAAAPTARTLGAAVGGSVRAARRRRGAPRALRAARAPPTLCRPRAGRSEAVPSAAGQAACAVCRRCAPVPSESGDRPGGGPGRPPDPGRAPSARGSAARPRLRDALALSARATRPRPPGAASAISPGFLPGLAAPSLAQRPPPSARPLPRPALSLLRPRPLPRRRSDARDPRPSRRAWSVPHVSGMPHLCARKLARKLTNASKLPGSSRRCTEATRQCKAHQQLSLSLGQTSGRRACWSDGPGRPPRRSPRRAAWVARPPGPLRAQPRPRRPGRPGAPAAPPAPAARRRRRPRPPQRLRGRERGAAGRSARAAARPQQEPRRWRGRRPARPPRAQAPRRAAQGPRRRPRPSPARGTGRPCAAAGAPAR